MKKSKNPQMKSTWLLATACFFVLVVGIQFPCWGDDSPFGFIQGGFARVAELGVHWDKPWQEDAGAGWAAVEPKGDSVYDFSTLDKTIKDAAEHKVHPYLVLKPFNGKYGVTKENGYPMDGDTDYHANWKTKLEEYVKAVVERYDADGTDDLDEDGDGVQDVPKIKYWGVGYNEIDSYKYWTNKSDINENDIPDRIEQYVDLIEIEYNAIKGVCSYCRVVLGGGSRVENGV